MDLGLERAGWECRWMVEIDPFARKVLDRHWPHVPKFGDIRELKGEELEPVDLIAGGFPCTDLSQAGKRAGWEYADGTRTRSGLWFEFARLVGVLRPRYVLAENVPGIFVRGGLDWVIAELARRGYVGSCRCLRAADFGAAHLRKRVFIVAHAEHTRFDLVGAAHDGNGNHASRHDADGCDPHVADSDGGQREQRGRAVAAGRNGKRRLPGSDGGGEFLGDTAGARSARCEDRGAAGGAPAENGIRREKPERRREPLADAGDRFVSFEGRRTQGGNGPRSAGADVSDSGGEGLPHAEQADANGSRRGIEGRTAPEFCGAPFAFAPGPADGRWPAILAGWPWLAPALEPRFLRVADESATLLDLAMTHRTKRLGRIGNAVVPACAQWIGERIIEFDEVNS